MTSTPFASNDPNRRVATWMEQGEKAAGAGRLEQARRHFEAVLQVAPDHIEALLWLAWLAGGGRPSLAYLARVLEVEPANQKAREAIRWARKTAVETPPAPSSTRADPTPSPPARRSTHRWRYALGGLVALALLLLAGLATAAFDGRAKVTATPVAWLIPSSTATSSPKSSATLPPTWTPVPSATPTAPLPAVAAARGADIAEQVRQKTAAATPGPTGTPTPYPTIPIGDSFRWIDVDLTRQRLTAYEGETPVREITVSTGLPRTPTVTGRFKIYVKYPAARMQGPDYDLPNVPWVMYFYGSYGIHGTYWHTNFGQPASHGCVNLPKTEAEWLYNWAEIGTLVNIHY